VRTCGKMKSLGTAIILFNFYSINGENFTSSLRHAIKNLFNLPFLILKVRYPAISSIIGFVLLLRAVIIVRSNKTKHFQSTLNRNDFAIWPGETTGTVFGWKVSSVKLPFSRPSL